MASNTSAATHIASALRNVAANFEETEGVAPANVAEIYAFCSGMTSPPCPLDADIADGVDAGYLFFWDAAARVVEGWPARPGLTAEVTILVRQPDAPPVLEPTPGSEEARAAAFSAIENAAGDFVGALLAEPVAGSAATAALQLAPEVPIAGDRNGDGQLEISSQSSDASEGGGLWNDSGFVSLLAFIEAQLAIGAGSEDPPFYGVSLLAVLTPKPDYFSYDRLQRLASGYIEQESIYKRLSQQIRKAQESALSGDTAGEQAALQVFVDRLGAGIGDWITRNRAVTLALFAQIVATPGSTIDLSSVTGSVSGG